MPRGQSVRPGIGRAARIQSHEDLEVYQLAFKLAMQVFELSKATETQVWIRFAVACKYLPSDVGDGIRHEYDRVIGKLVNMITHPEQWVLRAGEE